jgi:hypothetical protein
MRRHLFAAALILSLTLLYMALASTAQGAVTRLWVPLQIDSTDHPTAAALEPFSRISGWPGQSAGPHYYTYVKASRDYSADWPESWYIHQDGARVRDLVYGSFVMDPRSPGWVAHVISECPSLCYLDGAGPSSVTRTTPRLLWTIPEWNTAMEGELQQIVDAGIRVVPNSVRPDSLGYLAITGIGSTEAFDSGLNRLGLVTAGRVWVYETGDCGAKLAAYLLARGRGDLFSCHDRGTPVWQIPSALDGSPVGAALGPMTETPQGMRRIFRHASLLVRPDGSFRLTRR